MPEIVELNRITCKTVNNNKAPRLNRDEDRFEIMTVMGTITQSKVMTTNYGDSVKLQGTFKAIRKSDNAQFFSNVAYLPDLIVNRLVPILQDSGNPVMFAYDVSIVRADTAIGYIYECKPLMAQDYDPFDGIEKAMLEFSGLTPPGDDSAKKTGTDKKKK